MFRRVIRRVCGKLGASWLYQTEYGIKCVNQPITSDMFKYLVQGDPMLVPLDNIYLWVDHLNDFYTNIDKQIPESPHFEIMKMLSEGRDISDSQYIIRRAKGAIDFADKMQIDSSYIEKVRVCMESLFRTVESGNYDPIRVIRINNRYYIADGKHRAAICATLNVPVRCVDVSSILYDSFFWWVYRRMLDTPSNFSKHIAFYQSVLTGSEHG